MQVCQLRDLGFPDSSRESVQGEFLPHRLQQGPFQEEARCGQQEIRSQNTYSLPLELTHGSETFKTERPLCFHDHYPFVISKIFIKKRDSPYLDQENKKKRK